MRCTTIKPKTNSLMFNNIFSDISKKINVKHFDHSVLFIIALYCFTPFLNEDIKSLSEIFLGILLFFLLVINPGSFRTDKMTLLFFAAIVVQILSWLSVKSTNPEFAYHVPKIDRLGKLFLFIPIAWGLRKFKDQTIKYLAILAISGFFIGIVVHSNFLLEISSALKGTRIDFEVRNAQHPSMVFGVIFIFSFFNVFIFQNKKILLFLFIGIIIFSFTGIVFTQTRQTYFSLAVSGFVTLALVYFMKIAIKRKVVLLTITIVCGLIFSLNADSFSKRFNNDFKLSNLVENYNKNKKTLSGFDTKINFIVKNIPETSAGVRIKSIIESFKWIAKKPLLGWGSEGRTLVISDSENFSKNSRKIFGHMHNYIFEVLVSYGFLGLTIIILLYYFILKSSYLNTDSFYESKGFFVITCCFIIYWLFMNNFESYNSFSSGVFIHNFIFGCIYSRFLNTKERDNIV